MADSVVMNHPTPEGSLRNGLCESVKSLLKSAAAKLKGSTRRQFIAETVIELGRGGQSVAERELGWNRGTIRKGVHELRSA
jgi:DNA-binding protein Fis